MTTTITITGQISGNFTLANKIHAKGDDIVDSKDGMFNAKHITFATKKAAKKALWLAYKSLRADEPEFKNGIRYAAGSALYYDASVAQIAAKD